MSRIAAKLNKAIAYHQSGKHLIAKSFLEKVLKINSDSENALNHIGLVIHALEQYSIAINAYHKSLKLKADFVEVQFNLSNTYQACDRIDDASACNEKGVIYNSIAF